PLGVLCGEMSPSSTRLRLDWVAPVLLPAVNLTVALLLSAVVVLLIGESPGRALRTLASGAFGDAESIGYTLYYASNFVFTGLAVRARVAAGAPGQPRRDHHDHVQLHRLVADDLSPGQRPDQARPAVARDARVRAEHLAASAPRRRQGARLGDRALAAEPRVRLLAARRRAGLVLSLAHTLGLRAPR